MTETVILRQVHETYWACPQGWQYYRLPNGTFHLVTIHPPLKWYQKLFNKWKKTN